MHNGRFQVLTVSSGHGRLDEIAPRLSDGGTTVVGHRVASLEEAVQAAEADQFDCILLDMGTDADAPKTLRNRLLDKAGVDFEQHTAGEFKRTVTMFGKNSDKEREKLKSDLQETHSLFREFVSQYRPKLEIDKVATGEHWYGTQALELGLVDEIKTSDELLLSAQDDYDIYQLEMEQKKNLQEKLLGGLASLSAAVRDRLADSEQNSRYR